MAFRTPHGGAPGIDESYSFADVLELKRQGVALVMLYLSHTAQKNATAYKIRALHGAGIGALLGFEDTAGRALTGGYAGGLADGRFAAQMFLDLIREVGYAPLNQPCIPAAVDFDTNPSQWPAIANYFRGFRDGIAAVAADKLAGGIYGEADILDEIIGRLHIVPMGFGTYAWSYGRISKWDDFHQFLNGQNLGGASVDFDEVLHAAEAGGWWPPGHPLDKPVTPAQPPDLLEQIMALDPNSPEYQRLVADVAEAAAKITSANVLAMQEHWTAFVVSGTEKGVWTRKRHANAAGLFGRIGKALKA